MPSRSRSRKRIQARLPVPTQLPLQVHPPFATTPTPTAPICNDRRLSTDICTPVGLAGIEGLKPGKETIVLVTGAATWVGGHVAQALIEAGYSVRAAVANISAARVDFLRDMGCQLGGPNHPAPHTFPPLTLLNPEP